MAVAELDGIEEIGGGLDRVVVGHVREVQALDGKKVRLTQVDCGPHGLRTIICGAPNVAAGQHVAVALPGQRLGDIEIQTATVAGFVSHGMICSEEELGLSDHHDGILVLEGDAAPGTLLSDAFPIADTIFVIDNKSLTHRPDCWGHRGIAREIAALLGRPLKPLAADVADMRWGTGHPLQIHVRDDAACPRYSATTLAGICVAPSPLWLRLLLGRVGTRAINNVVDATNFVMLDLGNPLHAFDRRHIAGRTIVVRHAVDGERFTTLDGVARTLQATDLLIADEHGGIALAGVMGGRDSEIKEDTREVVLEAANFDPARVRVTAQRHGLRTDSSARFEKSLDPRLVGEAAKSFCHLVCELSPGAHVTSAFMDVARPYAPEPVIAVEVGYIERRLGHALGAERIIEILRGLSFGVDAHPGGKLDVTVPSWRATKDIAIADDLVEEVGRIFGYDHIPPAAPTIALARPERNAKKKFETAVRRHLSLAAGLDELQTYSFDDDAFLARIGVEPGERMRLRNPISSDEPCMRTSLVPHLLKVLERNARAFETIGVYEVGRVFVPDPGDLPFQPTMLGVLAARSPAESKGEAVWFQWAKRTLCGLARAVERATPVLSAGGVSQAWAHPVRQATLSINDQVVGHIAELHPLVLKRLDVTHVGAVIELELDALRDGPTAPTRYQALARFPAMYRDFAVLVALAVPAGRVADAIREAAPELVEDVAFQSHYVGAGVPDGDKSLAWSVTFRRADRTLTDAEIRSAEERIWSAIGAIGGRPRA